MPTRGLSGGKCRPESTTIVFMAFGKSAIKDESREEVGRDTVE